MKRYECWCGRRFWTKRGLGLHLDWGGTSFGTDPLGSFHKDTSYALRQPRVSVNESPTDTSSST